MIRLSAVIITRNEERNVDRCLDSLDGVVDEVVVVDSGSTDGTVARCRPAARGWSPTPSKASRRRRTSRWPRPATTTSSPSTPTRRSRRRCARRCWPPRPPGRPTATTSTGSTTTARRPIRSCGWYPDCKIRLWDRRRGRWAGGLVHETVALDAGARHAHLEGDLLHFASSRPGSSSTRCTRYAALWAREQAGRRVGVARAPAADGGAPSKSYLRRAASWTATRGWLISVDQRQPHLLQVRPAPRGRPRPGPRRPGGPAERPDRDERPPLVSMAVTTYRAVDHLPLPVDGLLPASPIRSRGRALRRRRRRGLAGRRSPGCEAARAGPATGWWRATSRQPRHRAGAQRRLPPGQPGLAEVVNDDMVFADGWLDAVRPHLRRRTGAQPDLRRAAAAGAARGRGLPRPRPRPRPGRLRPRGAAALLRRGAAGEAPRPRAPTTRSWCERAASRRRAAADERFPGPYHDPDLFLRLELRGLELAGCAAASPTTSPASASASWRPGRWRPSATVPRKTAAWLRKEHDARLPSSPSGGPAAGRLRRGPARPGQRALGGPPHGAGSGLPAPGCSLGAAALPGPRALHRLRG